MSIAILSVFALHNAHIFGHPARHKRKAHMESVTLIT